MKRGIAVLGFLVLFFSTSLTLGQPGNPSYLKFDYVKVQPNNVQPYIEYMNTTWKPLYQKRVKSGAIGSWSLYRVYFPGGMRSDYNFVIITSAPKLSQFDTMHPRDLLLREKQSQERVTEIMKKANSIRTIMFSELWQVINTLEPGEGSAEPPKYLMLDYMLVTPGREYDYQMLEDEFAKPIHQERIDTNKMQGWEVYSLVTPGGTRYGYNYATGNFFNSLENINTGFTEDVINNALPGTDVPEFFDTIFSTRELVTSELWELVDSTE